MKTVLCCLLLLASLVSGVTGQTTFQKSLEIALDTPMIRVTPDANTCYVASGVISNGINRFYLCSISGNGQLNWVNNYLTADVNLRLLSIEALPDGLLALFNSYTSEQKTEGFLIKFDVNGAKVWDRTLGQRNFTQLFEIQKDNAGQIWLSGLHFKSNPADSSYYFLSRLDAQGIPQQTRQNAFKYFPHVPNEVCKYIDLSWNQYDNSLVFIEDFNVPFGTSGITTVNRSQFSLGYSSAQMQLEERICPFTIKHLQSAGSYLIFSGNNRTFNGNPEEVLIGILTPNGRATRVLRRTPQPWVPVPSATDQVLFFDPSNLRLMHFDSDLNPVWSIKVDNCKESRDFAAEGASDGSIYLVRKVQNQTVVARIRPDGSSAACATYPQSLPTMTTQSREDFTHYPATGYRSLALLDTLHDFSFNSGMPVFSEFCTRVNADFEAPDTLCLGVPFVPVVPDTTAGASHIWDFAGRRKKETLPELVFLNSGWFDILHTTQTGICTDTAAQKVLVLPPPQISLGDTLLCGASQLEVNLLTPGATAYFLDNLITGPDISLSQTDTFLIRIENPACAVEKKVTVRIVPFDSPLPALDSTICRDEPYVLRFQPGFDQWLWDGKALSADSLVLRDGNLHRYSTRYAADTACVVRGDYRVPRISCLAADLVYVPNVFSPDGDGQNDFFIISPKKKALVRGMQIFDRWGSLVYRYEGETPGWDGRTGGRAAPAGVYGWWLEFTDLRDGSRQVLAGDVLLLR
jgi:gliding motility-associated-like protein